MSSIPSQVDVVIAGAGATGLAAALTLRQGGASVVVFEKQRSVGGSSNFFHGTFAVESALQRERFITYSRDEAFRNIMEYSHWRANARLVRAVVDESAATIDWLVNQGVVFTGQMINMPRAPQTYHVVKGGGKAVVKTLASQAKNEGAVIIPSTPVTGIVRKGERISGVVVGVQGAESKVACEAVVVATGGFANNKDWIKKHTGYELGADVHAVGNMGKMGDGLRMAWQLGAAAEGLGTLEALRVGPLGSEFVMGNAIEIVAMQPDLWVTAHGERFCDESLAFNDTHSGNVNLRFADDGYTLSLFDDSIIDRILAVGVDRILTIDRAPGYKPLTVRRELEAALVAGTTEIFSAASVEELARLAGMDPAILRATVDEYNRFCAGRHDDWFAKDPAYLRPLVGPKFYAVKARTVFLGTKGGIKINERTEVLDTNNKVIPGLYAGGLDAGGMYGDSYPIQVSSGLSSAFAINSGRIAGKNILEYLDWIAK